MNVRSQNISRTAPLVAVPSLLSSRPIKLMHVNSRGCPGCSRSKRRATKVQTAEQVHIVYLNAVKPSEHTVLSGDQPGSRPMTTAKNNNVSQRFRLMNHFFLYLDMFHISEHCYRAERFLMAVSSFSRTKHPDQYNIRQQVMERDRDKELESTLERTSCKSKQIAVWVYNLAIERPSQA